MHRPVYFAYSAIILLMERGHLYALYIFHMGVSLSNWKKQIYFQLQLSNCAYKDLEVAVQFEDHNTVKLRLVSVSLHIRSVSC